MNPIEAYNKEIHLNEKFSEINSFGFGIACSILFLGNKSCYIYIELKERYNKKMLNYLEDVSILQENDEDQCHANEKKVNDWVRKWHL